MLGNGGPLPRHVDVMHPVWQWDAAEPFESGPLALQHTKNLDPGSSLDIGIVMALENRNEEMVTGKVEYATLRKYTLERIVGPLGESASCRIEGQQRHRSLALKAWRIGQEGRPAHIDGGDKSAVRADGNAFGGEIRRGAADAPVLRRRARGIHVRKAHDAD